MLSNLDPALLDKFWLRQYLGMYMKYTIFDDFHFIKNLGLTGYLLPTTVNCTEKIKFFEIY